LRCARRVEERDQEKERRRSASLHHPGRGVGVTCRAKERERGGQFRPCPVAGSDRGAESMAASASAVSIHQSNVRPVHRSSPMLYTQALHLSVRRPCVRAVPAGRWPLPNFTARAGRPCRAVLPVPFPSRPLRLWWPRTVPGATASSKRGVVAGGCIGAGSDEALRCAVRASG
jgi:hypothetical protein